MGLGAAHLRGTPEPRLSPPPTEHITFNDQSQGDRWGAPEARYNERIAALIRAAVTPLDDDPMVVGVIGTVLVQVYFTVRGAGGSPEAALDVERQLLVPWLEARLAAGEGGG